MIQVTSDDLRTRTAPHWSLMRTAVRAAANYTQAISKFSMSITSAALLVQKATRNSSLGCARLYMVYVRSDGSP